MTYFQTLTINYSNFYFHSIILRLFKYQNKNVNNIFKYCQKIKFLTAKGSIFKSRYFDHKRRNLTYSRISPNNIYTLEHIYSCKKQTILRSHVCKLNDTPAIQFNKIKTLRYGLLTKTLMLFYICHKQTWFLYVTKPIVTFILYIQ